VHGFFGQSKKWCYQINKNSLLNTAQTLTPPQKKMGQLNQSIFPIIQKPNPPNPLQKKYRTLQAIKTLLHFHLHLWCNPNLFFIRLGVDKIKATTFFDFFELAVFIALAFCSINQFRQAMFAAGFYLHAPFAVERSFDGVVKIFRFAQQTPDRFSLEKVSYLATGEHGLTRILL